MAKSPFALLIKSTIDNKAALNRLVAAQGNQFISTKLPILADILGDITMALADFNLTVTLQVESNRLPCPLICIKGDLQSAHRMKNSIEEIGALLMPPLLVPEPAIRFFSGSRYRYIHQFDNKAALLEHIAQTIANDLDYLPHFTAT